MRPAGTASIRCCAILAVAACFHGRDCRAQVINAMGPVSLGMQEPQPDSEPKGLTLHVESRLAVVDVSVTDAHGQPVHGLTQANFTIEEDGKPQQIRSLDEITTPVPQMTPARLPLHVYTNDQPAPVSAVWNILLLDALNSSPGDVVRVQKAASEYLHSMPAGTRVAVVGLSNTLRLLQGFTCNAALLDASIQTADLLSIFTGDGSPSYQNIEAFHGQDERNALTLRALNQLSLAASEIKGHKNLIWLSAGSPTVIFAKVPSTQDVFGTDYSKRYARTTWLLNTAEISVYPVAPSIGSGLANLSLEVVARDTGGAAFYGTNDISASLAKAMDRGSTFYTLSYMPPITKYDGRHHSISIQVDQAALRLAYRPGYFAEDPAKTTVPPGIALASTPPAPSTGGMKDAMRRSMPTSTQLLFEVKIEPSAGPPKPTDPVFAGVLDPRFKNRVLTRYSFEYAFPARQIAFTTAGDGKHQSSLEFEIAAFDAQGKLVTSLGQGIKPSLTTDQYEHFVAGPLRFQQQIDLPSGPLFLRVGVRDATSDKAGTLEVPLIVPK